MYRVLLHNDDYTTMEFVVMILERIFDKDSEEATRIMLNVHHDGQNVAGTLHQGHRREGCRSLDAKKARRRDEAAHGARSRRDLSR